MRRSFDLGRRHDALLVVLSKEIGVSLVDVLRRALETLELQQSQRRKEVKREKS